MNNIQVLYLIISFLISFIAVYWWNRRKQAITVYGCLVWDNSHDGKPIAYRYDDVDVMSAAAPDIGDPVDITTDGHKRTGMYVGCYEGWDVLVTAPDKLQLSSLSSIKDSVIEMKVKDEQENK